MAVGTGYAQLLGVYKDAEKRLELIVRQAALRGNAYTESFASMQLQHIRQITDKLISDTPTLAANAVAVAYGTAIQAVHSTAAADANLQAGFTGVHERAAALLAEALAAPLIEAANTVGRQARDAFQKAGVHEVAVGLATGENREKVRTHMVDTLVGQGVTSFKDSLGRPWSLTRYADMVARTTTREAVSKGTANRLKELGLDLVTISDHGETDEECAQYAGNTYSLSGDTEGYEQLAEEPPFHPNLLPFDGTVEAVPLGAVVAGSRAIYTGELVDLATAGGVYLSIGPNHKVLTARGWLPAKALHHGDYIVRHLDLPRRDPSRPVENLDNSPALIEDIFDALATVGCGTRVASAPSHFHGDGGGVEGEIDVVWTDGLLTGELAPALLQEPGSSVLMDAGPGWVTLPGGSTFFADQRRIDAPSSLRASHLAHIARRDSEMAQRARDRAGGSAVPLTDEEKGIPGRVVMDKLLAVGVREVQGLQVGDLQTVSGHYWANGLMIHNCIHVMTPAEANQEEFLQQLTEGEGEPGERRADVLPGEPSATTGKETAEPIAPQHWDGKSVAPTATQAAEQIVREADGLSTSGAAWRIETSHIPDTLHQHTDAAGHPTPEREALWKQIIGDFISGHSPQENPKALFTAGGPASGKGALIDHLRKPQDAVRVDPDLVRVKLPEYKQLQESGRADIASSATHEEASMLAKKITKIATEDNLNIIIDGVGGSDPGKFAGKIEAAVAQGYKTEVRYASVPLRLAEDRNDARFKKTGRLVPTKYLREKHAEVVQRYLEEVLKLKHVKVSVYDTSVPRGTKPKLISVKPAGTDKVKVEDEPGQEDFEGKGSAG